MKLGLKQVSRATLILKDPSSKLYGELMNAALSLPSAVALAAHANATETECEIKHPLLTEVKESIAGKKFQLSSGSQFKKQEREIHIIRGPGDLLCRSFDFFCDRFRRSIIGGRRDQGYEDLRNGFYEMSDNVVAHSGVGAGDTSVGIVAYEATSSGGCFTVCDTGCGFVRSLNLNARWRSIDTHKAAISAVVLKQATSRSSERSGGGFRGLFAALAELNAVTLLRSGDCLAAISTSQRGPELEFHPSANIAGSQVSVLFSKSGLPGEEFH